MNQTKPQMEYQVLPTSDCITYLNTNNLTIEDWDDSLSIPSGAAFLYSLPNKEIVLIPTRIGIPYDGIIYRNRVALDKMIKQDFFPISHRYLTVFELERDNLKKLPQSTSYFEKSFRIKTKYDGNIKTEEDCKKMYESLKRFIKTKDEKKVKEQMILAYAVIIMDFFVKNKGAEWKLLTKYEIYNSYTYPLVIANNEWVNIISILFSVLNEKKGSFQSFKERIDL